MRFDTLAFHVLCALIATFDGAAAQTCNMCPVGKYKNAIGNAFCTVCPVDTYRATQGATLLNQCVACTGNRVTTSTGSSLVTSCRCNIGYFGADGDGAPCTQAVAGTYANNIGMTAATACPTGSSTLAAGSTSITACIANVGYSGLAGSTVFNECPAGTYSDVRGASACVGCTARSNSPARSTAAADCTCNAGSSGPNGGPCEFCVPGTYKPLTGSAVCTNCVPGKYSTATGATADAGVCTACPTNSNNLVAGSSDVTSCTCNAGATGSNGGTCTLCLAGKYKTATGPTPATCTDCGAGKYSTSVGATADAGTCLTCPSFTSSGAGSSALAACTCILGYTNTVNGAACTACGSGKYKATTGTALACTDCLANQFSAATGATASSTCSSCPLYSSSPIASIINTACACNPGYTGLNGGTCAECKQGEYKTTSGTDACTQCGNATYSGTPAATLASTCLACTGNSTSGRGSTQSTDCKCNNGYLTLNMGSPTATCVACAAGTYNDALGKTVCSTCGPGYFSEVVGAVGVGTCQMCVAGKYSKNTRIQCEFCPQYASSPAGSGAQTDCLCLAGFAPSTASAGQNGVPCFGCDAGKYKIAAGPAACTECLPNQYSPTVNASMNVCQSCNSNSASPAGSAVSTACRCNAGYAGPDGVAGACSQCVAGQYKAGLGTGPCVDCGIDTYSGTPGAVSSATCTLCFPNSVTQGLARQTSQSACVCSMGFEYYT